jgi:hypothetical protein
MEGNPLPVSQDKHEKIIIRTVKFPQTFVNKNIKQILKKQSKLVVPVQDM